jgi:hypothetical protein
MRRSIAVVVVIALSMLYFATGCVTRTTVTDAPRKSVHFESAGGAQTFYDAYLTSAYPSSSRGSLAVGVPLPYYHRTQTSENVHFNRAVESADGNHDGQISEDEARAYSAKVKEAAAAASACPV